MAGARLEVFFGEIFCSLKISYHLCILFFKFFKVHSSSG